MTLRALDLFCGAGGAALGLIEAGYEVVGVDSDPRCARVYPGVFVRGDFRAVAPSLLDPADFDLVWASPPCQRWSAPVQLRYPVRPSPDHVGAVRKLIRDHPRAVIENVPRAPLRADVRLMGPNVGLHELERLRHFELSWPVGPQPPPRRPQGSVAAGTVVTVTRQGGIPCRRIRAQRARQRPDLSPNRHHRHEMLRAMGLPADSDWTMSQIGEAVPPLYARRIAELALAADRRAA